VVEPAVTTHEESDARAPISENAVKKLPSWLPVAGIVLLAFVFRLVLGHYVQDYIGDSGDFTGIARNLAAGHGYSVVRSPPFIATDLRWPGYPAFLALAFVFNNSHGAAVVLNALLGAVATFLVYLISRALNLSSLFCLAATGVAAFFLCTASFAGDVAAENLSVPAVLAFVYVVLLRQPRSRTALFVLGSLLAWLAALTREELVAFVVIAAVVAGRRAHLRAFASIALVGCFLLGPALWLVRNEVQVHRLEYTDSLQADQALLAAVDSNEGSPLYREGTVLAGRREVTPAQRSQYQQEVFTAMKRYFTSHFTGYAENKVKAAIEYPFPQPIYGLKYGKDSLLIVGRLAWSLLLLAEYVLASIAAWRCWAKGHRWNVVALGLFPAFALCLVVVDNPVPRYWLPSVLLLLPPAFVGVSELPQALHILGRAILGEKRSA
jgi:hypothetical protein